MEYLYLLIAGFGGGVVRGLVGFVKHQYSYKNVGFNAPYFLLMMFISGVVGFLTSAAFKDLGLNLFSWEFTPGIAFIAGYAGGDFIENLYKIIFGKASIFEAK